MVAQNTMRTSEMKNDLFKAFVYMEISGKLFTHFMCAHRVHSYHALGVMSSKNSLSLSV